jgi:hypothetical protein
MVTGVHCEGNGIIGLARAGDAQDLKGALRVYDGNSSITAGAQQIRAIGGECNGDDIRHLRVASVLYILCPDVKRFN